MTSFDSIAELNSAYQGEVVCDVRKTREENNKGTF